jgi:hypothetical protein
VPRVSINLYTWLVDETTLFGALLEGDCVLEVKLAYVLILSNVKSDTFLEI